VILGSYLQKYFDDHNLVLNLATTVFIATGIITADVLNINLNIESLFFGDILLVNKSEVIILFFLTAAIIALVYSNFNKIIIAALNEEMAVGMGINAIKFKFLILLVAALSISIMVKIIGGLMITSLSIIPVFFAKIISNTPKKMLLNSIIFSLVLNLVGLKAAFVLDTSVAATVSMIQISTLFLTFLLKKYIL
jgi:zinc transport system permease protein